VSLEDEFDFSRVFCRFDNSIGSFQIADSRVCLLCYGAIKRASHLDLDGIHALTLDQVKKYLALPVLAGELVVPEADEPDAPAVVEPVPGHEGGEGAAAVRVEPTEAGLVVPVLVVAT
jgi:hypothetical protein